MEMTEHETKTTAPDSGLRIKTEVKGRDAASAPGGTAPDIVCKAVNLAYGDNHVLHDITMDMDDRRVTALIGPSGCGKSTLLRCLNRMNDLIDNVRIWGEIRVKGLDINALSTDVIEVRRRVGMVFQKSNPFPKSIYENVAYGPRVSGERSRARLDALVARCLKRGGLYIFDRYVASSWTNPARSWSWSRRRGSLIVRASFSALNDVDPVSQVFRERMTLEAIENGTRRLYRQTHLSRMVFPQELKALVELAGGFEFVQWFFGFKPWQVLERSRHPIIMVVVLRKK